jgi:hypothetical protein
MRSLPTEKPIECCVERIEQDATRPLPFDPVEKPTDLPSWASVAHVLGALLIFLICSVSIA